MLRETTGMLLGAYGWRYHGFFCTVSVLVRQFVHIICLKVHLGLILTVVNPPKKFPGKVTLPPKNTSRKSPPPKLFAWLSRDLQHGRSLPLWYTISMNRQKLSNFFQAGTVMNPTIRLVYVNLPAWGWSV